MLHRVSVRQAATAGAVLSYPGLYVVSLIIRSTRLPDRCRQPKPLRTPYIISLIYCASYQGPLGCGQRLQHHGRQQRRAVPPPFSHSVPATKHTGVTPLHCSHDALPATPAAVVRSCRRPAHLRQHRRHHRRATAPRPTGCGSGGPPSGPSAAAADCCCCTTLRLV